MHQGWYYEAFQTLSRSRHRDMGFPQPIMFSEITKYLDEYRVDSEELRDRTIHHIQRMDEAYIAVAVQRQKSEDNKTKT